MNKQLLKTSLCLVAISAILAACSDAYRYPCQDPAKANTTECSCDQTPRTKNKALGAVESQATTTTLHLLMGFDC